MSTVASAALGAAAIFLLVSAPPRGRLAQVVSRQSDAGVGRRGVGASVRRLGPHGLGGSRRLAAGIAGLCLALMIGGAPGLVSGLALAVAVGRWLAKLEPTSVRRRRERLTSELPLTLDLLAACLAAGRPPGESLNAVAEATGGPVAEELQVVAARLSLGSDPAAVWSSLRGHPVLAPFARVMLRSLETGAPMADSLFRLVEDQRRARRWQAEQRARSVGIKAAAPLALCFLPAFVAVGVVPTIASSFAQLLG